MKIFSARAGRAGGPSRGRGRSGAGPGDVAVAALPTARAVPESARAPDARASDPRTHEARAEALYRRYAVPLMVFCLKQTGGDRQWAEDVVQETFVRAWRNADRLDDDAESLMPWLATVARRIVIDDRRAKSARPQEVNPEPLEHVPGDDQWEPLLRGMVVADALQSLSHAHREVLVETVLRDRTVNEAAQVLGIPVGTVKSRVYYAIRALKLALEEKGLEA